MKTAEQHAIETGMAKGLAKGMEQGIQQGMQQGIEKGLQKGAAQKNLENAKKMMECNIDFETIFKVTGIAKGKLVEYVEAKQADA